LRVPGGSLPSSVYFMALGLGVGEGVAVAMEAHARR
jgi:hypothetical protein